VSHQNYLLERRGTGSLTSTIELSGESSTGGFYARKDFGVSARGSRTPLGGKVWARYLLSYYGEQGEVPDKGGLSRLSPEDGKKKANWL